ncbi:MAG: glucuronate isomerase [Verrucomicrobiota bacterium]
MTFLTDDFMLGSEPARRLYHEHAKAMPIYDYHCHLPPEEIAANRQFVNISQIWLAGDHYKWRAMRTNGVAERCITGEASDREKFGAWAKTVPATIGNPLYHWTHLELKRPFGIDNLLLDGSTAAQVWERTGELLAQPEFRTQGIIKQMQVRFICTTDDPVDDLAAHKQIAADPEFGVRVLPAFRPDKAFHIEQPEVFRGWLGKLEAVSGQTLDRYEAFLEALLGRLDYFHEIGARISDHALVTPVFAEATASDLQAIYRRVRDGGTASEDEVARFQTAVLLELGKAYKQRGWVMQFHISALRNNSPRMFEALGPDTGFDSIADEPLAAPLNRLLGELDRGDNLPKTILYTLNAAKNDIMATTIGNFQDGSVPGKMQFGSGWWFHDQADGMRKQMQSLANMGLLSRFVGMLTDSRSFLSYTRHEYFRRILCDMIGGWVDRGEAPADYALLGAMVEDICFNNAENYFGIDLNA